MDAKLRARHWGQSSEQGKMKYGSLPLSLVPLLFWRGEIDYQMISEQGNFRKQYVL